MSDVVLLGSCWWCVGWCGVVWWGVRWLSCGGVVSLMPCLGLVSRRELCLIIDGPGTVRLESGEKWRWRCWWVGRLSKYSHHGALPARAITYLRICQPCQANPTVPSYNGTSIRSTTATGALITTLSSPQQIEEDGQAGWGLSDSFQVQKIHYFQPAEDHHKSKDSIKGQKIFCQLFKYLAV